jgi:hypothetical protein
VGDYRCPPRNKLFSPLGWVRSSDFIAYLLSVRMLRFNNNYAQALDDEFADALKNLDAKSSDTSVPFWLIIRNTSAKPINFIVYTMTSDTALASAFDDNDRVLWENSDRVFSSLRQYKQFKGQPNPHSYTINPGQTVLRGIIPNTMKATNPDAYYPVGLFSAQLAEHFQLEAADILALGLIRGQK